VLFRSPAAGGNAVDDRANAQAAASTRASCFILHQNLSLNFDCKNARTTPRVPLATVQVRPALLKGISSVYAKAMRWDRIRTLAGAAALVGWAGLALQLFLMMESMGLVPAVWRYIGFYTILTNLGAAVIATAVAVGSRSAWAGERARLMAATSIIMVGIVYSVALRSLWTPTGLQKVADVLLHDAAPLLWALLWLVGPHVRRSWRELGWALLPPLTYCIYALARGAADGWYAYWFLDPAQQSAGELLASIFVLLLAFSILGALLIAVDQSLASLGKRSAPERRRFSRVEEAGEESFPASDPPSWTLGEEPADRP